MDETNAEVISLLWPPGFEKLADAKPAVDLRHGAGSGDLGLDALSAALSIDAHYADGIKALLATLCDAPEVIRYRQEVLADFLECPGLADGLAALLPTLAQLSAIGNRQRPQQTQLHQAVSRLGELELYVHCVRQLRALLASTGDGLRASGLCCFRDLLIEREADPSFQALAAELPALGAQIRNVRSVTLGVNLNPQLLPIEATLLGVHARTFKGARASLLGRLLGLKAKDNADEYEGIAPLHGVPIDTDLPGYGSATGQRVNPLLVPLFRDLNDILESVSKPVVKALGHYIKFNGQFMTRLQPEIAFYLGGVKLVQGMRAAGMPICRPEVASRDERVCEIKDIYNINFALRLQARQASASLNQEIVTNDVNCGDAGRIFILTGPNQGGKTTYTQAVGLAQVLCQAGLYVPGSQARISPVDGVYTHFPVEERPSMEAGRLGEEAKRLSDIFAHATRHSLVLLNESLASTSSGESLYLARDVLRALRLLGARVIFATHLHELADAVDAINAEAPGDTRLVSLVATTDAGADAGAREAKRTYKIVPGPSMGMSYARDIAKRYGISFEQLQAALRKRNII